MGHLQLMINISIQVGILMHRLWIMHIYYVILYVMKMHWKYYDEYYYKQNTNDTDNECGYKSGWFNCRKCNIWIYCPGIKCGVQLMDEDKIYVTNDNDDDLFWSIICSTNDDGNMIMEANHVKYILIQILRCYHYYRRHILRQNGFGISNIDENVQLRPEFEFHHMH